MTASVLASGLSELSSVVQNLRGALDADKGLSASLALKELQKVREQQERILKAIAEQDGRISELNERINKAGLMIKPLLDKAGTR